jgi:ABC-2 type transport system ATP-binding protein
VSVRGLTKVYRTRRSGDVVAVDDVSFDVGTNDVVGLLGPNGAGKTTTIKCICTLVRPTSGGITIDGADAIRHPTRAVEKVAAVLEGNRNIYWRLTPKENLVFFAGIQGIPAKKVRGHVDELISRFGLEEKANTDSRKLSRGMQQKLAVACAFIKQTPVLLLDEPTLGLDVETSYELRETLKQMAHSGERTILLSSHDMSVVQDICERVVIINRGKIVTDDRIDNLLALFRVRAYRFDIAGKLTPPQETALLEKFPLIQIDSDTHRSSIEVEFLDGVGLYELIDVLRGGSHVIESIDKKDPDFEEVFLKILKGETVR